ncbi:putative baseplate assembly protein [Calothrix sp. PCC 7507]|uniref:putative baseplate assembly protein n=1 Tax=Calothrix sp. PCC 7507 TaxID=99598 RepID=UPI00029F4B27|nr:putative baseplate assembly protein [Calothrix sp. PCC 7507]AFY34129.1 hypothetical protein Cal7507_3738 [Calothrix sp. PCC 7507]
MNEPCGCCEGLESLTPVSTANRPGLDALVYRVGTHGTFLETMKARLSSSDFPSLAQLKTRDANDPAIALLDAWATIADVLTFYQERIANEGYLRTATERRSVLELARLVGYSLRPGVAATVYPAFTMEIGYNQEGEIPAGTRIQSLPGPGELPQFFETAVKIPARTDWNNLKPRLTRPHYITRNNAEIKEQLYFQGISTNQKANDPLLLVFFESQGQQVWRRVQAVEVQSQENRTLVKLQTPKTASLLNEINHTSQNYPEPESQCPFEKLGSSVDGLLNGLLKPPSRPPANALQLGLKAQEIYQCESDIAPKLLTTLKPKLQDTLYTAWGNTPVTATSDLQSIQALRVKAAPFGANAPLKPVYDDRGRIAGYEEWAIAGTVAINVNVLLSDNRPQQATISIQRDTDTQSIFLSQEAIRSGTQVSVPGLTVRPSFLTTGGEFPSIIGISLTIQTAGANRVISMSQGTRTWNVNINPDPQQVVILGQVLRYSIARRKIAIAYLPDLLSVSEESPQEPSVEFKRTIALDAEYDQILPNSWVIIQHPNRDVIAQIEKVANIAKAAYGISGKVTQLTLKQEWLNNDDLTLDVFRKTTVYAQSEALTLAEEIINAPIQGNNIELGRLYDGLQPGRWLIVSGERADLGETTSVKASELVMLSGIKQNVAQINERELPGDQTHTFLQLAQPLNYQYKRDTVIIYGNVVKATHGETRTEVLGSGDGRKAFPQFPLRQPPLTYLAAPTPGGAASTLEMRVNNILWHETDSLAGLKPTERVYTIKIEDDGKTTVVFGNGESGARLPTGAENVRAVYRNGIGKVGNVKAEQINLLATRPLGLKAVINPLPATGGADRENRDRARRHAPLAVMSLDRLVSVQDYADFSRTFAGIDKASAVRLSDGRRQVVHLTIAGADDIPIDQNSDLYRNLSQALRQLGDPSQPVQIALRELMVLIISAKVKILPDYQWESVEPQIRQTLLDTFSFERRELGQDVTLSEVISTIQGVAGVDFVDVDILNSISETEAANPTQLIDKFANLTLKTRIPVNLARTQHAAQIAILSPTEPRTLLLNPMEVKP